MLRLTELVGLDVCSHGTRLGRIDDLGVSRTGSHPPVVAIRLKGGDGNRQVIEWTKDVALATGRLELNGESRPSPFDETSGLYLRQHVLDSQVVDLEGKRLIRVADVELVENGGDLRLAGIEVGTRPVLRRLGLGRLAGMGGSEAIDWADVHLASAPGHELQLRMPNAAVHRLSEGELAELVSSLPPQRAKELFEVIPAARPKRAPATTEYRRRRRGPRFGHVMRARRRAPR